MTTKNNVQTQDVKLKQTDGVNVGHTPGPWEMLDNCGDTIVSTHFDAMFTVARLKNQSALGDEQFANAQLIAAAPELLTVVEWLLSITYRLEGCSKLNCLVCAENAAIIDRAKEAVRVAKGGS